RYTNRIAQVDGDVLVDRSWRLHHLEVGVLVELRHVLEGDGVDLEVDAAPAQLQNARRGVGNGAHDDVLDLRRSALVLIERLEHHAIVGAEIDNLVRPGSNR